jgi:hypothetical protein
LALGALYQPPSGCWAAPPMTGVELFLFIGAFAVAMLAILVAT